MKFLALLFLLGGCVTAEAPPSKCSDLVVSTIDQWKSDGYNLTEQADVPNAGYYNIMQTPKRTRSLIIGEALYAWVVEPAKSQFQLQGICTYTNKRIKYYIYDQPNATTDNRLYPTIISTQFAHQTGEV